MRGGRNSLQGELQKQHARWLESVAGSRLQGRVPYGYEAAACHLARPSSRNCSAAR